MWRRVEFFLLVGLLSGMSVVLLVVGVADVFGPVRSMSGEVTALDREYPGLNCEGLDCFREDRDEPVYVVRGTRDNGSTWEVRGPEVHDAMSRTEGRRVQVSTSSLTGRIVALQTDVAGWRVQDSTFAVVTFGLPALWAASLGLIEWARRRGRTTIGSISRRQALWAVPAAIAGGMGTAWALLGQSG